MERLERAGYADSELRLSLAAVIALNAVSWYVTLAGLHDYVFGT